MRYRRWLLGGGKHGMALAALAGGLGLLLHVPAAFAFPYTATLGATTVYAERPIDPAIRLRLARADALVAASPLAVPNIPRRVVLTEGGWRWRVMALGYAGAIALRRPFGATLIFNRSDVAADRVTNGAAVGGVRTLSGTIAHETVHLLVARRYGEWRAARAPAWKAEGYADLVAGETSIGGAADEALIRRRDPDARVLVYYEGRRRVAAELARNGGSVDALFE